MANHTGNGTFQKGDDKRRNQSGQRNKAAVQFARTLRELIVHEGESKLNIDGKKHKKIELVIRQLYSKAMLGEGWAVQFIAERVEGKVKDQLDVNATLAVKGYCGISPDDWDAASDSDAST